MGALADGATMQTQETQDRAQAAQQVVLEGFKDLGFLISEDNTPDAGCGRVSFPAEPDC